MIKVTLNTIKDIFNKELIFPEEIQEKKTKKDATWVEARLEPTTSEDGNVVRYTCIKYNVSNKN